VQANKLLQIHDESDCLFVAAPDCRCRPVSAEWLPARSKIAVAMGYSEVLPSVDFETYSEAGYVLRDGKVKGVKADGKGGLPVVGTPVYAAHPSCEILTMSYNLKDGQGVRRWRPGQPLPLDLLKYVANGGLVEAWNVTFEFWIWNMVGARKHGWPPLKLEQCRCAMAKSRRYSLPGSLDLAAKVLGTPEKDKRGKDLVRKLTRPQKWTKDRPSYRWTRENTPQDFDALDVYCDKDVVAEDNASAHIPDLTPYELHTWMVDQTINVRGVQVDVAALNAALSILAQAEEKYGEELRQVSGGKVSGVNAVAQLREWAETRGVKLPDIKKETVDEALEGGYGPLPADVQRALQIRHTLGAANVKKLRTLALQVSSDGRLRDQYTYCGADRTGRWSAGGVQLQNITAKGPGSVKCNQCGGYHGADSFDIGCPRCGNWVDLDGQKEWKVEAVECAIQDVLTGSLEWVERVWGDPIALLCGCLRGLFIAAEGKRLLCCDFSAVEAVAAACLSRCAWRIEVFSDPTACIYTQSASKITGTPLEVYVQYKRQNGGSDHPDRKKIGKVAELASGYGGWVNAWLAFGAEMSEEAIKAAILAWRAASPEIVEMWGGQWRWCGPGKWDFAPEMFGLEGAAIQAVLNPGKCFSHIDITYGVKDDVLMCRLPSGRYLNYHRPRAVLGQDRLGRTAYQLTFEGYNSNSAKGPVGWHRMETFGGRLFENVVQAVSCDLQGDALKRLEARGYPVVMHTHDEATCELPFGQGSLAEMLEIMSERPSWANWWPLRADGWEHHRYQK